MSADAPNPNDPSKSVPGEAAAAAAGEAASAAAEQAAPAAAEPVAAPTPPAAPQVPVAGSVAAAPEEAAFEPAEVPEVPPLPAPTTSDAHVAEELGEPVDVTAAPVVPAADVDPAPPVAEPARPAESPAEAVERALADAVAGSPARVVAEPADTAEAETIVTPAIPEVAAAEQETVAAPIIAEPVVPVAPPVVTEVAPAPAPAPVAPVVYAQPLEEPRAVGNRLSGVLIGLLSTVIFAAAFWGLRFVYGFTFADEFRGGIADSTALLGDAGYWGAVIGFFVGTVIVALLVNRGGWWAHLLFGLLIAAFAYAGFIGGDLIAHRNEIYTDEVGQAIIDRLVAPMALIAFILGREVPIWFGLWTSALGRRAKARTAQAREEYEREVHG